MCVRKNIIHKSESNGSYTEQMEPRLKISFGPKSGEIYENSRNLRNGNRKYRTHNKLA